MKTAIFRRSDSIQSSRTFPLIWKAIFVSSDFPDGITLMEYFPVYTNRSFFSNFAPVLSSLNPAGVSISFRTVSENPMKAMETIRRNTSLFIKNTSFNIEQVFCFLLLNKESNFLPNVFR